MLNKKLFLPAVLSTLLLLQGFPMFTTSAASIQNAAVLTSRLAGADRYATSLAISQNGWTHASNVIIATGSDFPDALSASSLSKSKDAPIILTDKDSLSSDAVKELNRLGAANAFIIGGTGVISTSVEAQLKSLKINIIRLGGTDRYDTSRIIANYIGVTNGIVAATGADFPDALSIAPIASMKSMPIILSQKSGLDSNLAAFIKGKTIPVSYIVGGTGVLDSALEKSLPNSKRLSGSDRYESNFAINTEFASSLNFDTVYLTTGVNFPDALSGSALAAKNNSPIFLTNTNLISIDILNFMKSKNVKHVVILGGTGAVSQGIENQINAVLSPDATIDITSSFTDPTFKNVVYKLIGKASPAPILYSDVKGITKLDIHQLDINNLNGIEYFTALESLNCWVNNIKALDTSHNSALTDLDCDGNEITALDVSHNPNLNTLYCHSNNLTTLDVSHNSTLKKLDCQINTITTLDISNNTDLDTLLCSFNKLTTLDISKNKNIVDSFLTGLACGYNEITTLYASNTNYKTSDYNPQYTDSSHKTTTNNLTITIKN